jgi:hypothetical protein
MRLFPARTQNDFTHLKRGGKILLIGTIEKKREDRGGLIK